MTSKVKYHPEYHWGHPLVRAMMKWLCQCFVDKELREYFILLCCSFLKSGNTEKIFPCFTGEKDNSKSMIKQALELVFGQYSFTFSTEVLCSRHAPRASQQKALARNCKTAFAQEPGVGEKFNAGIIKELTGLDQVFGNLLYENGGNFIVHFVLILICNEMPTIPDADDAIATRLRAVPFLSTWTKNAPKTEEEQFKKRLFPVDRDFNNKIPALAPAFLWILVQRYSDYKEFGLREPQMVEMATERYWEEHDLYKLFTKECIEPAIVPGSQTADNPHGRIDKNKSMTVSEIYSIFKFWIRDTYPDLKVPNQPQMRSQLRQGKRWGKPINDQWSGIQPKQAIASVGSNFNMPQASNFQMYMP